MAICYNISMGEPVEQGGPEVGEPKTLVDVLNKHVKPQILSYAAALKSGAEDETRYSNLGQYSERQLREYLDQLNRLRTMIGQINEGAPFRTTIATHKLLGSQSDRSNPRDTFSLGFVSKDEGELPEGPLVQNQLRFHTNLEASGETLDQGLYALSIRGRDPHDVLDKFYKQTKSQNVVVNTVGVYRDPESGKTMINPQAGILFDWVTGQESARASGVIYVGSTPHTFPLAGKMPLTDFSILQRSIIGSVIQSSQNVSTGK